METVPPRRFAGERSVFGRLQSGFFLNRPDEVDYDPEHTTDRKKSRGGLASHSSPPLHTQPTHFWVRHDDTKDELPQPIAWG